MYGIPGHEECLLMVATDRISAFDVVMDDAIPGKGKVLTKLSLFWFEHLKEVVENHLISADVDDYPAVCQQYRDQLEGRSMLVKKTQPIPVECIVRGYISGSFWNEYQKDHVVCGFDLGENLQESSPFPTPLFTPSTKAALGNHDVNISLDEMTEIIGSDKARKINEISLEIYSKAAEYAKGRGIIIADTKFEFGEVGGKILLIDEVLTPDSSRFWPLDSYSPGKGQPSYDKQLLRDYLASLSWDKTPPPPKLPLDLIEKTNERYIMVEKILSS
ncbi:unnamed protein product [Cyprideis torosa]|uniref:phosphoribosylaminoimidazolesuccinocarboxamide synthase n=1 Tax=Cyprideis torosa TaxID=163714 RepID=A0A7R8WFS3_9CRUS|nr:unnamed protein product [Cyprideis torosa]CAG0897377.1 unnamed protein product [Cyprideis torosa]